MHNHKHASKLRPETQWALRALVEAVNLAPGAVMRLQMRHDDDCQIWHGQQCTCKPEIVVVEGQP